MKDINSYLKVEPEYTKMIIPIKFYAQDKSFINSEVEAGNYMVPVGYAEEPGFVKTVIPISAYIQNDHFS